MLMLKEYIIQNWALILVSLAFLISLRTTSFLDKTFANRMCLLILEVLILSVIMEAVFLLLRRWEMPVLTGCYTDWSTGCLLRR